MFSVVYLITFRKYKLWLLPNLNKDVGLLNTFWPLFELNENVDLNHVNFNHVDKSENLNHNDKSISKDADNPSSRTVDNSYINDKQIQLDNETSQNKIDKTSSNEEKSKNTNHYLDLESTPNQIVTEFTGNDHLPSITRTPPTISKFKSSFKRYAKDSMPNHEKDAMFNNAKLEIVDLNSEQDSTEDETFNDKEIANLESNDHNGKFASITPAVSYLRLNRMQKFDSVLRKRVPSNRSDDGFEILNNEFLNAAQSKDANGRLSQQNL